MIEYLANPVFWIGLGQIIVVNILLSGDNAVVIALASHALPPAQRRAAVLGGSIGAILLRVLFCTIVAWLLAIPYIKLVGGILLLWIGVKLMVSEEQSDGIAAKPNLRGAIQTIIIADAVMSLDNVVAIAAIAKGSVLLIVIGLAISVPLIIFGSQLVLGVLLRFPILVTAGAGLLGWIAGEIAASDPALAAWTGIDEHTLETYAKPALALFVMATGTVLARHAAARPPKLVDLAPQAKR